MTRAISIGGRLVGAGHPTYIIAELSGNHDGSYEKAIAIVHAAKASGADALKLQTYTADTITLRCDKPDFQLPSDSPWKEKRLLHSLYEKAHTPWEWHAGIFREARKLGMHAFSSPFDATAVDLLEELEVPAYKIASPEITDIPLIERVAATKKPVILSTGLSDRTDLELALRTLRDAGCEQIGVLKCVSSYPAPPESMNLRTIPDMAATFDVVTGLSDHSLGLGVPVAAVALGASIVEKHIVHDRADQTVDGFFSLDRNAFKEMVDAIRDAEKALGRVSYEVPTESRQSLWARRSLYVSKSIRRGEAITQDNIRSVRPTYGMHPKEFRSALGKKAKRDLEVGDRLRWDVLE
jgi:N-acetylneuraminate synthase/pseudaminic acid synthase